MAYLHLCMPKDEVYSVALEMTQRASIIKGNMEYIFQGISSEMRLHVFLEKTRSILQMMTVYARDFEEVVSPQPSNLVETMPKGTRYITLLYHQVYNSLQLYMAQTTLTRVT